MSAGGEVRHRRRIRFGASAIAAALAAVLGAALLTSSADAATPLPSPGVIPGPTTVTSAELTDRVAAAQAEDDLAGQGNKTSLSSGVTAGSAAGGKDAKIIGGVTTGITTAPWMAQLWYFDDRGTTGTADDIGFFCGGAVVAPTKILTAAHCVKGYNWYANGAIVTGTAQLPSDNGSGGSDLHGGTVTLPLRQWQHPSYNATTLDNDIAVLTLDVPVKATPIKMTTAGDSASYAAGTSAKVYGWGRTSSTSDAISEKLKTATLPLQSDTTCSRTYGSEFVKGHMVCAGKPATGSNSGTTTACNGDSGGPLVVNNRIIGVVSWGVEDCVAKGAYSVFSKVTSYVGAVYPRIDDTNISRDNRADMWVRKSSNKIGYAKASKGTTFDAREEWGNWDGVNSVLQTDLDRDGFQDLVYRRTSDGDVFWTHFVLSTGQWTTKKLADNWKTRTQMVLPGDVTGDYLPDLLSVDSAGVLWIYPGKGNGTFAARVKVGSGWNQYNVVLGHGDFTGDGRTDLIARTKTGSTVYLYKGTGKAGTGAFSARVKVRTWSGFNAFDAVGDITGDGKADLLARTPAGKLSLYPGTGKATSEIFATPIEIGTDFKQYDLFG
ncbi:trypsin-like serine protease [Streptomyces sp. NPDC059477]|uniref:trypsin-like serine protease n=1 Tax=Streptomyces sp. NPDC059477 TaxID=3346847 RepID=UPI0036BCA124